MHLLPSTAKTFCVNKDIRSRNLLCERRCVNQRVSELRKEENRDRGLGILDIPSVKTEHSNPMCSLHATPKIFLHVCVLIGLLRHSATKTMILKMAWVDLTEGW